MKLGKKNIKWVGRFLKRHKGIAILVCVVVIGCVVGVNVLGNTKKVPETTGGMTFETMTLEKRDISNSISVTGTIASADSRTLTSTLTNIDVESLNVAVGDTVSAGDVLDGLDVSEAKDKELSNIRNEKIGFVFQTYNLIARTSALKNVELPMLYAKVPRKERTRRAKELLELVGMGERMGHKPDELSGGQKQRVAIARAMANDPSIILADEPTGALDSKTGRKIMDLFHKLNKEQGKTIVLITHSPELAAETGRIITIKDGYIIGEEAGGTC